MRRSRPRVIVITGGVATGKSTAVEILMDLGYRVLDSDKIVHEGYNIGSNLYYKVLRHFGEEILGEDKTIDRQKLGKIVFNDGEKLSQLNEIVHAYVYESLKEGIEKSSEDILFLDIPLLFETKDAHEIIYDEVWLIYVSEVVQRQRLIERAIREKKRPEEVLKIIDRQIAIDEKLSMVDEVINNEGSKEELRRKIKKLLEIKK